MNKRDLLSVRLQSLPQPYNSRMDKAHAIALEKFAPEELLEFTIGNPDKQPESELVATLARLQADPANQGYTVPAWGNQQMLQAWAEYRLRHEHVKLDWSSEVCGVRGSRLGLLVVLLATTNPGDAVMVPNLVYPGELYAITNAFCEPVYYDGRPGINVLEEIQEKHRHAICAGKKVKAIFLVSPGNPHGHAHKKQLYPPLINFAASQSTWLLQDEAYLQNVFSGKQAFSLMEFDGSREVGVSIRTLSKLRNVPDWRAAFIEGNRSVILGAKTIAGSLDYGLSKAIQGAVVHALQPEFDSFPLSCNRDYEDRDRVVRKTLREYGVGIWENHGGMFASIVIPKRLQPLGSTEVAAALLEESGTRVNPGTDHGPGGGSILRFAYTKPVDVTRMGAHRIGHFMMTYKPAQQPAREVVLA